MNYAFLIFPNFKDKCVTLSYDDGLIYDKKLIEILDKYGLKCTFNLNSEEFASKEGVRHLTKEEAIKLYKNSAHEIAVHGAHYISLSAVSSDMGTIDIIEDRKNLENMFGRIIKGMAYANGSFDENSVQMLKNCGIKYARTCLQTGKFDIPTDWLTLLTTCHHANPELNKYLDDFLCDKKNPNFWRNCPKLFYLWGHSYEFNDNNNWEIIENFAKKVGKREDIWYATNGEVYDYIKVFESLEYSVDGSIIKNNSCFDIYMLF